MTTQTQVSHSEQINLAHSVLWECLKDTKFSEGVTFNHSCLLGNQCVSMFPRFSHFLNFQHL